MQNNLIGESTAILTLLDEVSRLAPINRPLLIIGERGTGKEIIAERIHFLSERWDQPFIKINCAAFSEQLLDSELFGHEAGAFTGASKVHRGHFERADRGTLFLDELATLSLSAQEKILRLIEYGEFQRLGGHQTLTTDVRIVAATNGDILKQSQTQHFRADLLDRLAFDVLNLPPLREREGDIELLIEHFALKMTQELGREFFSGFSAKAVNHLLQYSWPGNIRELRNVVERSIARHTDWQTPIDEVRINPFKISSNSERDSTLTSQTKNTGIIDDKNQNPAKLSMKENSQRYPIQLEGYLEQHTEALLQQALVDHHFNQKITASALGINYDRMRYLVRKYSLQTKR